MAGLLHDDEIAVDPGLVRALVDRAMPGASGLPLTPVRATGSSNSIFRLGDELAVRLPRQPGGSSTIDKEARWLPMIAQVLAIRVPEVVKVGEPDLGYPERWSVVRWLPGEVPSPVDAWTSLGADRNHLAADLAAVIAALRTIDVGADALRDQSLRWYRGEPLAHMDERFRRDVDECRLMKELSVDLDAALELWTSAVSMPSSHVVVEPRWLHGDLLAENVLVRDGGLGGLLDFGGLAIGDPTIDLVGAWELLDSSGRQTFRTSLELDDETWLRAMAWALAISVMTFPYYWHTMPNRCRDRLVLARNVVEDFAAL